MCLPENDFGLSKKKKKKKKRLTFLLLYLVKKNIRMARHKGVNIYIYVFITSTVFSKSQFTVFIME